MSDSDSSSYGEYAEDETFEQMMDRMEQRETSDEEGSDKPPERRYSVALDGAATRPKKAHTIVQAAAGAAQECGSRVDAATKKMKMPDQREDGRRYDSVRAGPHRPAMSGPGDGGDGDDASIIWVLYKARAAALSSPPSRACC